MCFHVFSGRLVRAMGQYYEDDWPVTETEHERKKQYQIEILIKQLRCLHVNAVEIGYGAEINIEGKVREHITMYCEDCCLEWDEYTGGA